MQNEPLAQAVADSPVWENTATVSSVSEENLGMEVSGKSCCCFQYHTKAFAGVRVPGFPPLSAAG